MGSVPLKCVKAKVGCSSRWWGGRKERNRWERSEHFSFFFWCVQAGVSSGYRYTYIHTHELLWTGSVEGRPLLPVVYTYWSCSSERSAWVIPARVDR